MKSSEKQKTPSDDGLIEARRNRIRGDASDNYPGGAVGVEYDMVRFMSFPMRVQYRDDDGKTKISLKLAEYLAGMNIGDVFETSDKYIGIALNGIMLLAGGATDIPVANIAEPGSVSFKTSLRKLFTVSNQNFNVNPNQDQLTRFAGALQRLRSYNFCIVQSDPLTTKTFPGSKRRRKYTTRTTSTTIITLDGFPGDADEPDFATREFIIKILPPAAPVRNGQTTLYLTRPSFKSPSEKWNTFRAIILQIKNIKETDLLGRVFNYEGYEEIASYKDKVEGKKNYNAKKQKREFSTRMKRNIQTIESFFKRAVSNGLIVWWEKSPKTGAYRWGKREKKQP